MQARAGTLIGRCSRMDMCTSTCALRFLEKLSPGFAHTTIRYSIWMPATCAQPAEMHSNLAKSLQFPDYYGRNLDALNDCLRDVAFYAYGARGDAAGTALVLSHFNVFARKE